MTFRHMFTTFIVPFITPSVTLISAFVVYRLGKSAYFRQKEYELVTKRYLNEGLDAISENVDRLLAVFRYNLWYSKIILDHFNKPKNLGADLNDELLIVPESSLFGIWQIHRLKDLTEDYHIFYDVYQALDAFVRNSYSFFRYELFADARQTIKDSQGNELTRKWDTLTNKYGGELAKLSEQSFRFYSLRAELQELAYILQSERLSFRKVEKIKYRPKVKLRIENFKGQFPDLVNKLPGPPPRGRSKQCLKWTTWF